MHASRVARPSSTLASGLAVQLATNVRVARCHSFQRCDDGLGVCMQPGALRLPMRCRVEAKGVTQVGSSLYGCRLDWHASSCT